MKAMYMTARVTKELSRKTVPFKKNGRSKDNTKNKGSTLH